MKEKLQKIREQAMKAEKMIVEIEKTEKTANECQGNRLSEYRDKLREMREDVTSETGGDGDDL